MQYENSQKGLTIVELMIVLSIAGLILFVVMLAIPTLQRNGSNNQRKQDVAAVLQAVSSWSLNHSGEFPNFLSAEEKEAFLEKARLTYYTSDNIHIESRNNTQNNDHDGLGKVGREGSAGESMVIANYARCSDDGSAAVPWGAGYNDVVAIYATETRTGSTPQCKEL